MKLDDFMASIEPVASLSWAEDWDNSGVMVRSASEWVSKIAVALDPTEKAVEEACSKGCDCLLTHHPLIFAPLKNLGSRGPVEKAIFALIEAGMCGLSCHTTWDNSPVGTNVSLGKKLGLKDMKPIAEPKNGAWGDGTFGFTDPMDIEDLSSLLVSAWGLSSVRFWPGKSKKISKVALCGGSGGFLWKEALKTGAHVFITADLKYHLVQEALSYGIGLVQCDHGEMEWASMDDLAKEIRLSSGLETVLLEKPHNLAGSVVLRDPVI